MEDWISTEGVVANFSSHLIIIFPLFWGMIMYDDEYKF